MNENLKNRILGSIVLLCITIIFLPMIFNAAGEKELKFKKINHNNDIKFNYINNVKIIDKKEIKNLDIVVTDKIINNVNALDIKNNIAKEKSWIIRVGIFSDKNNAISLLNKLSLIHYQTHIHNIKQNNKVSYALNIGPFFDTESLKKKHIELSKDPQFKNIYIIETHFIK